MTYYYHTHHKVLLGDLHTPVSTYLKVRDLFPQSALMESSDYHGTENNRSFIGLNPIASISVSHGIATLLYPDHSREEIEITNTCSVEQVMNRFLSRFRILRALRIHNVQCRALFRTYRSERQHRSKERCARYPLHPV